jgi:hypothetical protein
MSNDSNGFIDDVLSPNTDDRSEDLAFLDNDDPAEELGFLRGDDE